MKAVIYDQFGGPLMVSSVPDPVPGPDDVVLEVRCTGLCLSDWHGWRGHDPDIKLPHVPGHELAGVVVAKGKNVRNFRKYHRVTLPFVCGCGGCDYCKEGNPQVCDHQFQPGFTNWGSFAQYVRIEHADFNLVCLPDYLSFEQASILGCRFSTSYRALIDQGQLKAGQWVAIHGCGGVGLSAIMIAVGMGARVIAVDLHQEKLQFARALGAEQTVLAFEQPVAEAVKTITGGGAHVSVDAVGKSTIVNNSIDCLRKGGRHLQVGLLDPVEQMVQVPFHRVIAHELQIAGSHGMQASRFGSIFDLIEKQKLDPAQLITERISLEQSAVALAGLDKKPYPGITVIDQF